MVDDLLWVLLGEEAESRVAVALPPSATLVALSPEQVLYRPGRRLTVRYDATVRWGDGRESEELLVASAREGEELAVWRGAEDPELPGLDTALDPAFARRVLADIGLEAGAVRVTTAAYRPGSRAVVEVEADVGAAPRVIVGRTGGLTAKPRTARLYLKVMEPAEAERVADVYRALAGALPVARCHEVAPGVLALEGLPGRSLGRTLRRGEPAPPPDELVALSDRLATVSLPGEADGDARRRLARHAELLRAVLPEAAQRIDVLEAALSGGEPQPIETIHGDLHEGQILVADGRVSGLLDVDDAGPGERVDDLALLTGRLWVLGQERGDTAYVETLLERAEAAVDPHELRRRIGISLLGRVTGPFRNQLDRWRERSLTRLEIAERWTAPT